jgi:LmbE family N-acetylglucosaminyl deacetylase
LTKINPFVMNKRSIILLFALMIAGKFFAQPKKYNSAEIFEGIKKLNVLGSVLYVAAHPDDENTNLISFLSNDKHLDARYLSLTRGDGGQNLIGPEQAELLGVIRTQELLRARGVDGGKQAFSRANDFGFSKNPTETMQKWDKEKVLGDIVWAIRKYQPDVVINRFSTSTERPNHGHHTASAILAIEAYDLAANPSAYPEQLKYVQVWQPKRHLMNLSWWFYGGREKFELLDKSKWLKMDIGSYYPSKGKSNTEIAAESRSQHRCQGMGTMPERGEYSEYFETLKGTSPNRDILEGINTTWSRIEGASLIGIILTEVTNNFNFDNPSASVPRLLDAYKMIEALPDSYWKRTKYEEIKEIIRACMGLYIEASAADYSATSGENLKINFEITSRSSLSNVQFKALSIEPIGFDTVMNLVLAKNKAYKFKSTIALPTNRNYTNSYWLNEPFSNSMYQVNQQELIGLPETPRALKAKFALTIGDRLIDFPYDIAYKFEDAVKGEIFRPLEITPPVFVNLTEKVYVYANNQPKNVDVIVKSSSQDSIGGTVILKVTNGWKVYPEKHYFGIKKKGQEQTFTFSVYPPLGASETKIDAVVNLKGNEYSKKLVNIQYDHIPTQMVLQDATAKCVKLDFRLEPRKTAYIMGAGDEIPPSLRQVGYDVTLLDEKNITDENLKNFEVVIMGIRAYNTVERLKVHQPKLYKFVENGGTMIVQYNNNSDIFLDDVAPYKMKISRDRVTDENAEMKMLNPNHQVLKSPNFIGTKDFEGWVQERGLYFATDWDAQLEPIFACNDPNEAAKNGSLLIGKYGKGYYVYTGLAFFRQLPAGVSGAYRLFGNIISLQGEKSKSDSKDKKKSK